MFTVGQRMKETRMGNEVIIEALRDDLKPGMIIYETKRPGGAFAGFYQESELEPAASNNPEQLERINRAMHLIASTDVSINGEGLVYLGWDEQEGMLLYTFKLMPSEEHLVFSFHKP